MKRDKNRFFKNKLKISLGFYFSLCALFTHAQQSTLKQIISSVDSFNTRLPAEQLYLHFNTVGPRSPVGQEVNHDTPPAFHPVGSFLCMNCKA